MEELGVGAQGLLLFCVLDVLFDLLDVHGESAHSLDGLDRRTGRHLPLWFLLLPIVIDDGEGTLLRAALLHHLFYLIFNKLNTAQQPHPTSFGQEARLELPGLIQLVAQLLVLCFELFPLFCHDLQKILEFVHLFGEFLYFFVDFGVGVLHHLHLLIFLFYLDFEFLHLGILQNSLWISSPPNNFLSESLIFEEFAYPARRLQNGHFLHIPLNPPLTIHQPLLKLLRPPIHPHLKLLLPVILLLDQRPILHQQFHLPLQTHL